METAFGNLKIHYFEQGLFKNVMISLPLIFTFLCEADMT